MIDMKQILWDAKDHLPTSPDCQVLAAMIIARSNLEIARSNEKLAIAIEKSAGIIFNGLVKIEDGLDHVANKIN